MSGFWAGNAGANGAGAVAEQSGTEVGSIAGQVMDATTGAPVAGAKVVALETGAEAESGPAGQFVLSGLAEGRHEVEARADGYETRRAHATVTAGETAPLSFAMEPLATRGAEQSVSPYGGVSMRLSAPAFESLGVMQESPEHLSYMGFHQPTARFGPAYSFAGQDRESYARIVGNEFRRVATSPLSTFSIDVDRASYANVRRFVQSGVRPPADAVRIEELINYFPRESDAPESATADPAKEAPFSVAAEVGDAPWSPERRLVRIALHAKPVATADLPPANLVFLLDTSGSMDAPHKLPLLKRAFALLVEQLRPIDRLSIVQFTTGAQVALPPVPGSQRREILEALDGLEAYGGTAGAEGVELAYRVARQHFLKGGNNRVILATDGDFNVGLSSDDDMVRLIEKERESGVFLTVLGFGTGNLKDSKMERIANHGNGSYHYMDGLMEARKALVEEMGGTLLTVAKDVKIQVEFNPAQAAGYRLIGYENRLLDDDDFSDDAKDAGDLGAGQSVTALYEVTPAGTEVPRAGEAAPLRYQPGASRSAAIPEPLADELMHVSVRYKDPDGEASKLLSHPVPAAQGTPSADFRFAAAVAAFGMLLRESPHAAAYALDDVVQLAEQGKGADPHGYRAEFVRLVQTVRDSKLLEQQAEA